MKAPIVTAPHRHRVRIKGHDGAYYAHCPDCGVRGPDYHTVGEAYQHHKADFLEVTALQAAEKAKARETFDKLPGSVKRRANLDMLIHGDAFVRADGERIDPSEVLG